MASKKPKTKASNFFCSIQCGKCKEHAEFDDFRKTAVNGDLPKDHYQCPNCHHAFAIERKGEAQVFDNGFIIPPDNVIVEQPSSL